MDNDFKFKTEITVNIGDINYGGHLGNDKYLIIFHEGRLRYLKQFGFSEMDIGDKTGLIMSEAEIKFKAEAFWNDRLNLFVRVVDLDKTNFNFEYLLKRKNGDQKTVATGRTRMVAFDYTRRSVKRLPEIFIEKINRYEGLNE